MPGEIQFVLWKVRPIDSKGKRHYIAFSDCFGSTIEHHNCCIRVSGEYG
jgi:hypothetical protein